MTAWLPRERAWWFGDVSETAATGDEPNDAARIAKVDRATRFMSFWAIVDDIVVL